MLMTAQIALTRSWTLKLYKWSIACLKMFPFCVEHFNDPGWISSVTGYYILINSEQQITVNFLAMINLQFIGSSVCSTHTHSLTHRQSQLTIYHEFIFTHFNGMTHIFSLSVFKRQTVTMIKRYYFYCTKPHFIWKKWIVENGSKSKNILEISD